MIIAIGAILKNEHPYVTEWIAYHKAIGFNKFYIVDNISNDGTSELLANLHKKNEIVRLEYKTIEGVKPQVPAYNLIIEQAKNECDYIAFIDADEFFHLDSTYKSIECLVDKFKSSDDIGAIAINWSVYGSSNCIIPGSGLVIERFDHRAKKECPLNFHYKSFIKMSAFESTKGGGVHHFTLKNGFKYIMTDGGDLTSNTGLSDYVSWDICRLNHYVIKSNCEFFTNKKARGRAAGNNDALNISFFNNHDKNDVRDALPYQLISTIKSYKKNLEISIGLCNSKLHVEQLYKHGDFSGRSYIDHLAMNNNLLEINGWVSYASGDEVKKIILVVNKKHVIKPISFIKKNRPDVSSCGISNYDECGFNMIFDLSLIVCHSVEYLDIYAVNDQGDAILEIKHENKSSALAKIFPNKL